MRLDYEYNRDARTPRLQLSDDSGKDLDPARGFRGYLSFYPPKDGKEDLGPHACTIRISSCSFHERVHGDLPG